MKAKAIDSFHFNRRESRMRKVGALMDSLCFENFILFLIFVDLLCITTELLIRIDIIQDPYRKLPVMMGDAPAVTQSMDSTTTISPIYHSNSTILISVHNTSTKLADIVSIGENQTDTNKSRCYPSKNDNSDNSDIICENITQSSDDFADTVSGMNRTLKKVTKIVHYMSVSIVSFFVLEIFLRACLNGKHFVKYKWNLFDSVVVIVSFILELVYTPETRVCIYCEAATYLIVLRLWKIPQICNIQAMLYKQSINDVMVKYELAKRKSEETNRILHFKLESQNNEIKRLESFVMQLTSCDDSTSRSLPNIAETGVQSHPSINMPSTSFTNNAAILKSNIPSQQIVTNDLCPKKTCTMIYQNYLDEPFNKFGTAPNFTGKTDCAHTCIKTHDPMAFSNEIEDGKDKPMIEPCGDPSPLSSKSHAYDNKSYCNDEGNSISQNSESPTGRITGETYTNQDGIPMTDL